MKTVGRKKIFDQLTNFSPTHLSRNSVQRIIWQDEKEMSLYVVLYSVGKRRTKNEKRIVVLRKRLTPPVLALVVSLLKRLLDRLLRV